MTSVIYRDMRICAAFPILLLVLAFGIAVGGITNFLHRKVSSKILLKFSLCFYLLEDKSEPLVPKSSLYEIARPFNGSRELGSHHELYHLEHCDFQRRSFYHCSLHT